MKRAASISRPSLLERTNKIRRTSPVLDATGLFSDPTKLVYVTDLRNCTEVSGYIQGRVNMKWPHSKKQHILLDTLESALGNSRVKVDVYFQAKCGEILEERDVHIEVGDEIALSLQGVKIEEKPNKGLHTSLKMTLRYADGALLNFVTRRYSMSCGTVNTWVSPSAPEDSSSQDWFDTPRTCQDTLDKPRSLLAKIPMITPINEDDTSPAPNAQHDFDPISIKSEPRELTIKDNSAPSTDTHTVLPPSRPEAPSVESTPAGEPPGVAAHHPAPPAPPAPVGADPPPKSSKRKEKRQKDKEKKQRKLKELARLQKTAVVEVEREQSPLPANAKQPEPMKIVDRRQPEPEPENVPDAVLAVVQAQPEPEPEHVPDIGPVATGPLALNPGRKTRFMTFVALSEARNLCTVAGVVISVSTPSITRTGEFHCTLYIVDPSICKKEDNTYLDPFQCNMKVNCFNKHHIDCLPCPQFGDVVILKDVKASDWNGKVNLVGYYERLHWAIYSPERQEIHHGDSSEVQKADLQQKGALFTPFHDVREGEVQYCKDLVEWWRAIEEEQKGFNSRVIHLGGEEAQHEPPLKKTPRPHWQIKDIQPHGDSNGYFDATIEVVHSFKPNLGNYHILFVTDYTSNEGLEPFTRQSVHSSLSTSVARLECWDNSRQIATDINVGSYVAIKNVKCRISNHGSYELKVQENKIRILSESDARYDKALAGLLERKKAHQNKYGSNDPSEIEHRFIQDAAENVFFSSVVEILQMEPLTPESTKAILYVTDYTPNSLLHELVLPKSIPASLGGRVLKLVLCESQAQVAKQLKEEDVVSLHRTRITKSYANGMSAVLSGDERLVNRLYLGVEKHKVLIEGLNKNKEAWKQLAAIAPPPDNKAQEEEVLPKQAQTEAHNGQPERKPSLYYTPIKEVMEIEACPMKFRVYARIADFFPSVEDWVYRSCKNCKKDIPAKPMKRRACFDCNDVDHEYVEFKYRFWLMLEDEKGTQIIVSVVDYCPMLDGLPRTDLAEDEEACQAARSRLSAFGGNVQAYISDQLDGKETKLQSPLLQCILVSWNNSENEKLYSLKEVHENLDT